MTTTEAAQAVAMRDPQDVVRERLRDAIRPGASIDASLEVVERVYAESGGAHERIPWSHRHANPALVAWLNARASGLIRCGARVAVVGCGLGQDAVALAQRGYDVLAFDACPSAIEHAKALHPEHTGCFRVADLRSLPSHYTHRFDLVVEVHTLQALPPEHRPDLARGIAGLVATHGHLLVIARGRRDDVPLEGLDGPPYALLPHELVTLMNDAGLTPLGAIDDFEDDGPSPARRLRGVFVRRTLTS